jgi:hypothetical protein
VLRFASRIAAGALLLLVGVVAASERSSAEPNVAKQTTTTIRFSLSEKGHLAVPGGRELSRISGTGTLTIDGTPQEGVVYSSMSATGVITFHRWLVLGRRVIDEDNVSMDVLSGQGRFTQKFSSAQVEVKVTKSDAKERDPCDVGSAGAFGLIDGKVKARPDSIGVGLCGVQHVIYGGVSGHRAVVRVTIAEGTP